MNKFASGVFEILKIVVVALAIVVPVRYFLFQPFFVKGASMEPTYADGQYLIVDEISWRLREPQRGEVVVFKYPKNESEYFIKRIIGLPGETIIIDSNKVFVQSADGKKSLLDEKYLSPAQITEGQITVTLNSGEYFVMGDNRQSSYDSRRFGPVDKKFLVGRSWFRAWPMESIQFFSAPQYSN